MNLRKKNLRRYQMILTIDTHKDSKEDIKKAIEILQKFTESSVETSAPADNFSMPAGIFDAPIQKEEPKPDPKPRIEPY